MDHNIPKNELLASAKKAGNWVMLWITAAGITLITGLLARGSDHECFLAFATFLSGFSLGMAFCSFQACVGLEYEANKIDGDGKP